MEDCLKEALELVRAQAGVRAMNEEEIISMLKRLTQSIHSIAGTGISVDNSVINPTEAPEKAIKEKSITCIICGKSFKLLTKKHLAAHGLTADEYRERCGYKKGTALVCKHLQRERRKKMQSMRLWERRQK